MAISLIKNETDFVFVIKYFNSKCVGYKNNLYIISLLFSFFSLSCYQSVSDLCLFFFGFFNYAPLAKNFQGRVGEISKIITVLLLLLYSLRCSYDF